jgi:hypothetical protein
MGHQDTGPAFVVALDDCTTGSESGLVRLRRGNLWAAEDPLCVARPWHFGPVDESMLRRTTSVPFGESQATTLASWPASAAS